MEEFQSDKERAYYSTEGWKRSTPEQQEMDSSFLAGTYSALGAGGQKIYVIPDLDMVIIVTSRTSLVKDNSHILNDVVGRFILPSVKMNH